MTNEALSKIRAKSVSFKKCRHSRDARDYKAYARARNQVKWACRKAERDYEKKLAKEVKRNPKAFFKYAKTKLKTRSGIQDLVTEDGITYTTENQKANVLNEFFSSVFTKEDAGPLPEFVDRAYDETLENITIRLKIRRHTKKNHLNVNKAIRDGKYLARHMPVIGNVHPIKIENFDIFA